MYLFSILPKAEAPPHIFTNSVFCFKFGPYSVKLATWREKKIDPMKIKRMWLSKQLKLFLFGDYTGYAPVLGLRSLELPTSNGSHAGPHPGAAADLRAHVVKTRLLHRYIGLSVSGLVVSRTESCPHYEGRQSQGRAACGDEGRRGSVE